MAKRGRKAGFDHSEETRSKIKATSIVNRLMSHIEADGDLMTNSQVNAAKVLLGKVLPDLKATELSGGGEDGELEIIFKTVYE